MSGIGKLYKRGRVWWIRYWHRGREFRESSGSEREVVAERLLKERWKQIGRGRFVGPGEERLTVNQLLDAVTDCYRNDARRTLPTLPSRLKVLREAFGQERAVDVKPERIEKFKADLLAAGKAAGTVNRALSLLRRAFRLAVDQDRLSDAPPVKLLREHNVRQGFVNPGDFEAVVRELPAYLQDFARFAFLTGWRKGELATLTWDDIDRSGGRVSLRREHSKNEEPRVLVLVGDLATIIERRWDARHFANADGSAGLSRLVFHRAGRPVADFRKAWRSACKAAGLKAILFHDLRRSAIRNMEKAGVSQSVAMKISGHRTTTVYRRYRIVDEQDIGEALARTQAVMRESGGRTIVPLAKAVGGRPVGDSHNTRTNGPDRGTD